MKGKCMGRRNRRDWSIKAEPMSEKKILGTMRLIDDGVHITISTHLIWQILNRKLIGTVTYDILRDIMLDSYVVTSDQRPKNIMVLLNNDGRKSVYLVCRRCDVTIVLDEDVNKKTSIARTIYSSNQSAWTTEWIRETPFDKRLKLDEMLRNNKLRLECHMPKMWKNRSIVDGVGANIKIIDDDGDKLAFIHGDTDEWKLGVVEHKFSDGSMRILADTGSMSTMAG